MHKEALTLQFDSICGLSQCLENVTFDGKSAHFVCEGKMHRAKIRDIDAIYKCIVFRGWTFSISAEELKKHQQGETK